MNKRLNYILVDILDLDEKELLDEVKQNTTDNWDSMNHLRLITAVEQEFDIKLSMTEIQSLDSVGKLRGIVKKYIKHNECK